MNNAPDYSIHRAAGAGEISGQRMVTNKKEDRPREFGRRKGRPRRPEAEEPDGVKVELSEPSDPADSADPSDSSDAAGRCDDEDSRDSKSVDCLA